MTIENWSAFDPEVVVIDLTLTQGKYFPMVTFVFSLDESGKEDGGITFPTGNSYTSKEYAIWDCAVSFMNMGFQVSHFSTIFSEDGEELETYNSANRLEQPSAETLQ